jgi:hypothetical protein
MEWTCGSFYPHCAGLPVRRPTVVLRGPGANRTAGPRCNWSILAHTAARTNVYTLAGKRFAYFLSNATVARLEHWGWLCLTARIASSPFAVTLFSTWLLCCDVWRFTRNSISLSRTAPSGEPNLLMIPTSIPPCNGTFHFSRDTLGKRCRTGVPGMVPPGHYSIRVYGNSFAKENLTPSFAT